MGIFKGPSPHGKNKFLKKFLTFFEKYMSFGVEPLLGEFEKLFCLFRYPELILPLLLNGLPHLHHNLNHRHKFFFPSKAEGNNLSSI